MNEMRLYYDLFKEANKKNTLESVDLRTMNDGLNKILEAYNGVYEGVEIRVGMSLHADAGLIIRIGGERMYDASSTFISKAGMPDKVLCDDYARFDAVLKYFNKRTEAAKTQSRRIVDM